MGATLKCQKKKKKKKGKKKEKKKIREWWARKALSAPSRGTEKGAGADQKMKKKKKKKGKEKENIMIWDLGWGWREKMSCFALSGHSILSRLTSNSSLYEIIFVDQDSLCY